MLVVATARRGEAPNGGERRWPAARGPSDWRVGELLGDRCLVEENEQLTAKLWSVTAGLGVERNGGEREMAGARVSARGLQRRRGREEEAKWGFSTAAATL
jgi:hypothetical protein